MLHEDLSEPGNRTAAMNNEVNCCFHQHVVASVGTALHIPLHSLLTVSRSGHSTKRGTRAHHAASYLINNKGTGISLSGRQVCSSTATSTDEILAVNTVECR